MSLPKHICINSPPKFIGLNRIIDDPTLSKVIKYLNGLPGEKGFIYKNYSKEGSKEEFCRNYFSQENAQKLILYVIKLKLGKINK